MRRPSRAGRGNDRGEAEGTRLPAGHPGDAGAGRRHGGRSTTCTRRCLPAASPGVDVFFVISGFLITGHLLREYQKTGKVALLDFWGRRAKRLVPAAALVLTVTWVGSRLAAARDAAGGHRVPDPGERALLPELAARVERGRLPQVGQRGEPGAALLVAVRRGAVLPGLAAAVPARGARGAHGAATEHRRAGPRAPRGACSWRARSSSARSGTRSTTRTPTRRAPTS